MVQSDNEPEDDSGLLEPVGHGGARIKFEDLKGRVEIASGTFGTVLKAEMYGTPVAVKRNFKSTDHNVEKYLKREVSALQAMHHPNIVQVCGFLLSLFVCVCCSRGGDFCWSLSGGS
jgi:Protein tyrosine and serine/threonine kinase